MTLEPHIVSQVFLLYSWFVLMGLLGFLVLIARFYEHFSGERTFFRWYGLPALLYGIAALRYSALDQVVGDPSADLLAGAAGVALIVLVTRLFHQMTAGRKAQ